jgi:hypothetical protein
VKAAAETFRVVRFAARAGVRAVRFVVSCRRPDDGFVDRDVRLHPDLPGLVGQVYRTLDVAVEAVGVSAIGGHGSGVFGRNPTNTVAVVVVVVGDTDDVPVAPLVAIENAVASGIEIDDCVVGLQLERRATQPRQFESTVF